MLRKPFYYDPEDDETIRALNTYLISLVVMIAGGPLPMVGLFANIMFYFSNRKATYFVRWHTMQALLSQISLYAINTVAFWWIMTIIFGDNYLTSNFIAFMITVSIFNISEFIATLYTISRTRKGQHVEWWFYSDLTNLVCKA